MSGLSWWEIGYLAVIGLAIIIGFLFYLRRNV